MNTPLEPIPEVHPIRTFMAVAISEAIRDKLTKIQERLKQTGADVGWVAPANIHFTILFLGTVFESQVSALAAAADGIAAAYQPCTLEVKGLGYFGRPQSPRVIWAGLTGNRLTGNRLTGDLQPLLAMQSEIAAAAKRMGIFTDDKPLHPHFTIGRVRSARNIGALLAVLETCRDTNFGTITIDRVLLMKSEVFTEPCEAMNTILSSIAASATEDPPCGSLLRHSSIGYGGREPQGFLAKKGELTAQGPVYTTLHESRLIGRVRNESGNESPGFHPTDRSGA